MFRSTPSRGINGALFMLLMIFSSEQSMAKPLPYGPRLAPRRMGHEHDLQMRIDGCEICQYLAGGISGALLAGAPACAAQDLADRFVNEAKTNPKLTNPKVRADIIAFAKRLCQAEKNTPPDYKHPPHTALSAVYCHKPPQNEELRGLYTIQHADNNASAFFDPTTKTTILLGSIPETRKPGEGNPAAIQNTLNSISDSNGLKQNSTDTKILIDVSDYPKCADPQIQYVAGAEGRSKTEFTYAPVNRQNFNQGVALDIAIITKAICDIIQKCVRESGKGKDDDSKGTVQKCRQLQAKIGNVKGDGGAADIWNEAVCS